MVDTPTPLESDAFDAATPHSSLNPIRLVWRHRWLVMLGVVVGCVLGALYYSRLTPIYQSSALVLVVKKAPDTLPLPGGTIGASFTEDYLSTHMSLIRSPVIVGQAVQKANLGALKSFAGHGDPTGEIINSLKITREMNGNSATNILNISFRCPEGEDGTAVVKAVIESYQQFNKDKYKNVSDETAKSITDAHRILQVELAQKQREHNQFRIDHPVIPKGKDGVSFLQQHLSRFESKRSELVLQGKEIQGKIDALEKAMKDGRHSQSELLAMIAKSATSSTPENAVAVALDDRLMTLELQEKTLLEYYGQDYPDVRSVRRQVAQVRSQRERLGKSTANAESGSVDPVKAHVAALKLEVASTQEMADALKKGFDEEQRQSKPMLTDEQKDEALSEEIARSKQLFDAIAKRVEEVSILKNFTGGFEAETIAPPSVEGKVYPRPFQVFGTAAIMGLLAGFALAYLAERADQSFRTPEEVRRSLGLPIVGHIPHFGIEKKRPTRPTWRIIISTRPSARHTAPGRTRPKPTAVFAPPFSSAPVPQATR